MDWTTFEAFIRTQSGMNASKVSQAELFQYVNIVREEVRSMIEDQVWENYWHGKFTGNLVSGTNVYDLWSLTGTGKPHRVTDVEVLWDSSDAYPQYIDAGNLQDQGISRKQLKSSSSTNSAFWVYEGNNIVLYPEPKSDVANWLEVYATYTFDDIDQTASDWDIYPWHPELKNYEHVIMLGVLPYMERQRNIKDKVEIRAGKKDYLEAVNMMIKSINSKYPTVMYWALPNTKNFQI